MRTHRWLPCLGTTPSVSGGLLRVAFHHPFATCLDGQMLDVDILSLTSDANPGTCSIAVNISPGAINKLTSATITSVAQDVLNTCPTLAGSPGGWGLYGTSDRHIDRRLPIHTLSHFANRSITADTFLTITSTTDPLPPPSASLTPGEGELQIDTQAYFLRSFWYGGETGGVNITVCLPSPSAFLFRQSSIITAMPFRKST